MKTIKLFIVTIIMWIVLIGRVVVNAAVVDYNDDNAADNDKLDKNNNNSEHDIEVLPQD